MNKGVAVSSVDQSAKKILIIRFHAFGDVICTLPYIAGLKDRHPDAEIHLLTTKRVEAIPRSVDSISKVFSIEGGMHARKLLLHSVLMLPVLLRQSYDLIIDLQNDRKSGLIRKLLGSGGSRFEKYAPKFAGDRYLDAINSFGLDVDAKFSKTYVVSNEKLDKMIERGKFTYIVINPAGFFETRNWPIENYVEIMQMLSDSGPTKFLLIGDARMKQKADYLESKLPEKTINLVEKTSQLDAYELLSIADLVISEDSGLGHMSWVQGIPTLFLFGSTRADWTAPQYEHVFNLSSSDLECGDCMLEKCIHGDVRCLTRYSPEFVFERSMKLLSESRKRTAT